MANDQAVKIYEDNQRSIALDKNPEFHKRTKHIDIRYHFVREKVDDGQVLLEYCPTQEMLADLMTKTIPAAQFDYLRSNLDQNTKVYRVEWESCYRNASATRFGAMHVAQVV